MTWVFIYGIFLIFAYILLLGMSGMGLLKGKIRPFLIQSYCPCPYWKKLFWPVIAKLFVISEWNFTDMFQIKGYILWQRTVSDPGRQRIALPAWLKNCWLECKASAQTNKTKSFKFARSMAHKINVIICFYALCTNAGFAYRGLPWKVIEN